MHLSLMTIAWIMIVLFLILMFLRMPISVVMILCGLIGLILTRGLDPTLSSIGVVSLRTGINYDLSVIALFVWMGLLATYGGIAKDAFATVNKWIGHLPGGLAIAAVCACAAFGAVCGSHVATALTMSSLSLPEMRKYGYPDKFSLGCLAASGDLGILIPPSTAFIVYGVVTETSIGALFISGIIPGVMLMVLFCIYIYVLFTINTKLAPRAPKTRWRERFISLKGIWSVVLVFLLVMGGIYLGLFTPTEGGAVGAFVVLVIGFATRQLNKQGFMRSLFETAVITAMIMLLIIGARIFSTFITTTELPATLATYITSLSLNRWFIMAVILIFYLLAGCILDIFAILIITLPIVFPIITGLGFDPIYFGVLSILCVMLGSITPPFGVVVFALHGMNREVPLFAIFSGVMPFVGVMLFALALLTAIPQISTVLPNLMMPYR